MKIKNYSRMRLNLICIFFLTCLSPSIFAQHEQHVAPTQTAAPPAEKKTKPTEHKVKLSKAKQSVAKKQSAPTMKPKLTARGVDRTVNLVVGYKMVNFAGTWRKGIAVNDQIPAPTLHFKEGDHVTINVYNHLNVGTAIHWHGILVPWQMDGVEHVTQHGIPPGGVFHYQFTLYQSGTYWYHAHAMFQEQDGLYGAFIIDPSQPPHYTYTKDYVIVLSDWNNSGGDQIFANLKKEGDYYSPRFPLQPSLMKFLHDYGKATTPKEKKMVLEDYKMMQQMRMSIYDFSDVAYDAFLLNGQPSTHPWTAPVKVGDVVRLRFIEAGGSTNFHVKIHGAKMEMVHVQGNDVKPYSMDDFFITPGETDDVLVKIQKNSPYIIYAESADTIGAAYGALITSPQKPVDYKSVPPFPEPLPVTREMMHNMMLSGMNQGMGMGMGMGMDMKAHSMMNKSGSSKPMNQQMMMSSHSMKMGSSTPNHDMKSMPTKNMKGNSNHSDHSSQMMKSESSSPPMKHNMDISGMDHGSMNMQMPKANESPHSTMEHSSTKKDLTSAPMQTNSKNSHHRESMSKESMRKMSANHTEHKAMSGDMKMGDGMKMDHGMSMDHSMAMPTEPTIVGDTISPDTEMFSQSKTVGTKYQNLTAAVKTNDPNKPVNGVIRMELFGYMDRFIWFINGLPEYRAKPILIEPGKRYRIIFTNNSMMHHPMHIHGHWFIVRNGHGAYDPLLHTIDVPPGATVVADIDADASGQWFFHCHHLYHMMAGMSRVFQYTTIIDVVNGTRKPENFISQEPYHNRPIVRVDEQIPIDTSLVKHAQGHPEGFYFASFLDVGEDPFHNVQEATFKGLYGFDYNKLELFTNDAEMKEGTVENADIDIFYWHLISQFWAIKGGANYFYRPAEKPYWQPGIGIEGLMPYFIDTNVRSYYHSGSAKLDVELSRDTQITNNFFIRTGIRSILASKTVTEDEVGSGLNQMRYTLRPYYRLMPGLNIFTEYEHDQDYGTFKNLQRKEGESTRENTITFGFSVLF